jgi:hypothetical protein
MDVELAEERILVLADRFNLDHAEGRATSAAAGLAVGAPTSGAALVLSDRPPLDLLLVADRPASVSIGH